jgi:murein DD-endopeptidase MepM/ murein hydrolase activator NlpD
MNSNFKFQVSNFKFLLLISLFSVFNSHSQINKSYPKNYFRNPLGIPIHLNGNFGQMRKDHFHMGFDLRTNRKENYPVYASADGYVSRVKIERLGYGRSIYIKHPNGYITVYAHLNNFYDTLNSFVKNKQYKDEQWEQDFELDEEKFPVKKGQFIAYSGNTGGSEGPHLHFEIREDFFDSLNTKSIKERTLNPMLFGFQLADKFSPRIDGLYWYDRRYSTYETSTNKIEITKPKNSNNFIARDSVVEFGTNKISFGISAVDQNNNSSLRLGIYSAQVFMDSVLQNSFELKTIETDKSHAINGCIDYPFFIKNKIRIQHISAIGRNRLYYELMQENDSLKTEDYIELRDTLHHKILIEVKDISGNASSINFVGKYNPTIQKDSAIERSKYGRYNYFWVYYPDRETDTIVRSTTLADDGYNVVYDSASVAITREPRNGFPNASDLFHVGDYAIPVDGLYRVQITLNALGVQFKNKLIVQLKSPVTYYTQSVYPEKDYIHYYVTDTNYKAKVLLPYFGDVQVLIDTVPPTIKPVNFSKSSLFNNKKEIIFKVDDDLSSIKKFRAELDGKWLMFSRKNDLFIYEFDERCSLGEHQLKITAEDEAGNIAEKIFPFTKEPPKLNKSKKKTLVKGKNKKQSSAKKKKKK